MDAVTEHRSPTSARGRRRGPGVAVLALAVLALLGACGGEEAVAVPEAIPGQVTKIDSAEGRAIIDAGDALVVDVRTVEEYQSGHLVGAQSIPVEDEELWLTRTEPLDRDRPTVVYCRSGRRSEAAAQLLVDAGFTQVYDLGGVEDWDPEDLRVEAP
jgi:rhodanese-related sulfurtransferase